MIQAFRNFIHFFRNQERLNNNLWQDIGVFCFIFSLNILAIYLKHFVTGEPIIDETSSDLIKADALFSFILFVPFIEEFTFRAFLNFRYKYIYILSLLSSLFFAFSFIKNTEIQLAIYFITILLSLLLFSNSLYKKFLNWISNNKIWLIIISSIAFGIIHFLNYEHFEPINTVFIIQKIIGGLFLAYIVYKYNIWYSWLFHIINNAIPGIIIYFATS